MELSADNLSNLKSKCLDNVFIGYININSVRNKLDNLIEITGKNLDVLCIAETKIDNSFPTSQFCIKNYNTPYRLDVSSSSGGLLVYVKNGISSRKLVNFEIPKEIQILPIELSLKNCKW